MINQDKENKRKSKRKEKIVLFSKGILSLELPKDPAMECQRSHLTKEDSSRNFTVVFLAFPLQTEKQTG